MSYYFAVNMYGDECVCVMCYNFALALTCRYKSLPRGIFSPVTFSSVDTIIFVAKVLGFAA